MIRVSYCYPYAQKEMHEKFFSSRMEAEAWLFLVQPYLWDFKIYNCKQPRPKGRGFPLQQDEPDARI